MVRAPEAEMSQPGGSRGRRRSRSSEQRLSTSGCTASTCSTATTSHASLRVGGVTLSLGHQHVHHWTYPTSGVPAALPGAATFHFGPGFEPHQLEEAAAGASSPSSSAASTVSSSSSSGSSGAGDAQQHVVHFHVNPGVTVSFQMGDNVQVIKESIKLHSSRG